jgi:schlafen family protein
MSLTLPLLPDDLSAITFDDIVRLVERLEFEPGPVDFKAVLNPTQGQAQALDSLRRTAVSMANTEGGWVLFGVVDRQSAGGVSARERIVGIPLSGELRKELGNKLEPIAPHLRFDVDSVQLPDRPDRGILIARIPLSALRPHMFENVFYRRGDGGSAEKMRYFEVRDQMLLTQEKLQRGTLLRLELAMYRQVAGMIQSNMAPDTRPISSFHRFDTVGLKTLVAATAGALPAEPAFMRLLLMIPIQAAEMNNTMDRAQTPTIPMMNTQRTYYDVLSDLEGKLLSNLRLLQEVCEQAESVLEAEFGPVPFKG